MTPEDRILSRAIAEAVAMRDKHKAVQLVMEFYDDRDRCDRTPRGMLLLHIGLLAALVEMDATAPQAAGDHGHGCPCPACRERHGDAIRAIREAAQKAGR